MTKPVVEPTEPEVAPESTYEPFSWIRGSTTGATALVEITKDIAGGVRTALEILEVCRLDEAGGDKPPLIGKFHQGELERFCISSLWLLEQEADRQIAFINKQVGGE